METEIRVSFVKSDFKLICKCGTTTRYGSSFKTRWIEGMYLECRECGTNYYPELFVRIKSENN